jgi:hypothetical protein
MSRSSVRNNHIPPSNIRKEDRNDDYDSGSEASEGEERSDSEQLSDEDRSQSEGEEEYYSNDEDIEEEQEQAGDATLTDLWRNMEEMTRPTDEEIEEANIAARELAVKNSNAKKTPSKPIKYYDPPVELKKLLDVISSGDEAAQSQKIGKNGVPLVSGNTISNSRRVNACGALKAITKKEKNRVRLGRTRGVVFSLCQVLKDSSSTVEEKYRCSNTLMMLCVPKQNWEAVFRIDGTLLEALTAAMSDDDARVRYNACFCAFLLAKAEENRVDMFADSALLNELVGVVQGATKVTFQLDTKEDNLAQTFHNLGTPSGIRQQGDPASEEESKLGARLSSIKTMLSLSKVKEVAYKMANHAPIMKLLMRISGTMTVEEDLMCMAIFTNLTRHPENAQALTYRPKFLECLKKGLGSTNSESKHCASLAIQNLSCEPESRKTIVKSKNMLNLLTQEVHNKMQPKTHTATMHAIKNLCLEPSNIIPLTENPGAIASFMIVAKDGKDISSQYIACDGLATMSQWLKACAHTCLERNAEDFSERPLLSLGVSTWNQWE